MNRKNQRLRWFGLCGTLWAIPAFLLLMLIGSALRVHEGREAKKLVSRLEKELARFTLIPEVHNVFGQGLRKEARKIGMDLILPPKVAGLAEQVVSRFPSGSVEVFLFDGSGRLVSPIGVPSAAVENLFEHLRTPLNTPPDKIPELFASPPYLLLEAPSRTRYLRGRPGTVQWLSDDKTGFPTHGFYLWSPGLGNDRLAGLLALIHVDHLHPEFWFSRGIPGQKDGDTLVGFEPRGGNPILSAGWNTEQFKACKESLKYEPGERIALGRLFAVSQIVEGGQLIVGARLPPLPGLLLLVAGLLYAGISWIVLWRLWDIVRLGRAPRFSLTGKLLALMAMGILFPIGAATGIALLEAEEQWDAILAGSRQQGLERLDRVDADFEQFLCRKDLEIRRKCGEFASEPLGIDKILADFHGDFESMDCTGVMAFSAESKLLAEWKLPKSAFLADVFDGPIKERASLAEYYVRHGWRPDAFEMSLVQDARPRQQKLESCIRKKSKEELVVIMRAMGRRAMDEFNSRHGNSSSESPEGKDLAISGMLEKDLGRLITLGQLSLGHLAKGTGETGEGYFFGAVIPGPGAQAAGFIFIEFVNLILPTRYLRQVFSSLPHADGRRLLAFTFPWKAVPAFPNYRQTDPFVPLLRDAKNQQGQPVQTRLDLDGEPYEVAARMGNLIPEYFLVEAVPHRLLAEQLGSLHRWEAVRVGLAVFICFILTWLAWDRLMPPVMDLQRGLAAMRRKDFCFRLPTGGTDELAMLFGAFNRAMAHLADMEIAAVVQQRIFPAGPLDAGPFRISGRNQMSQSTGGDYYDYFSLKDGRVVVAFGDVTGHGISAALVTAIAKATLAILSPRMPDRPDEVLRQLNSLFLDCLDRKRAMTLALGVLDPGRGSIKLAIAGQCAPLLVTRGKAAEFLKVGSYPVGVSRKARVDVHEIDLPEASGLVMYSDGLIEAVNEKDQQFGFERFSEVVIQALENPNEDFGDQVFESVRRFTGSVPWMDDASLLIIKPYQLNNSGEE